MLNPEMDSRFSHFYKKYNLKRYYSSYKPAIFFSLWGYGALKNHKSFALVVWRGTDVLKMGERLRNIRKKKNVHHVAISSYIEKDLDKYGIKYKSIPIVGGNNKYFKPCKMGEEIYTYVPSDNIAKYHLRYGMKVINKIRDRCKYKINIIKFSKQYSKKKLAKIYERCFCGLRMTKHDGLPNQVIEMGLMGRKSFYNGNIPGSIKWDKNIDNIVENLEEESKKINTTDYNYAKEIKNYINVGDEWLDTDFWEK